jgi:hypothetical protein
MDHCKEQSYDRVTFHHSTFWKLMVKVNQRSDEYTTLRRHGHMPKDSIAITQRVI